MMKPFHKRVKHFLEYLLVALLLKTFSLLPVALGRLIGKSLGTLAYFILPGERTKALSSLNVAYPSLPKSQKELRAKMMFQHFGEAFADVVLSEKIMKNADDYIVISDKDRTVLSDCMSDSNGTIYITAHLGNWEVMAHFLAHLGHSTSTIAKEIHNPWLNKLVLDKREKSNVHVLLRGRDGSNSNIMRSLKKPGFVGFLIDQKIKGAGVWVDFFGKPAFTPRGAAQIALKMNLRTIAGFCVREPDGKYRLITEGPFSLIRSDDPEQDIIDNTALFTKTIQEMIQRYPEQWVWMHQRWKKPND